MEYFAFASNLRPLFYVEAGDLAAARKNAEIIALEGETVRPLSSLEEQEACERERYESDPIHAWND